MTHPRVYLAPSPIDGTGVFAAVDFQPGDHILTIDDSRVVTPENPLRPERSEFEHHCDYLVGGAVVLMQPPERHINHACDPNTYVQTLDGVRVVIALRPIHAGEEITYDYAINGVGGVPWECRCGASCCRGPETWADFFRLPRHLQAEYFPLLDRWFVEQHRELLAALNLGA